MRNIPVIGYARMLFRYPLEAILCSMLVAMVVVAFAQVVSRYVLHVSLSWSEEVARFLLMWLVMLGAAYAFKTKSHFAMALVVNCFGERLRKALALLVSLVIAAFMVLFVVLDLQLIFFAMIYQTAPATQISMAVPYSSGPVGGILMIYYIIQSGWTEFRRPAGTTEPG